MIATGDSLHDAKHVKCLSWSQSQHKLNSSCFLKKTWACYNLQKFTGCLSTCWHTVCIFIIQTKLQCMFHSQEVKKRVGCGGRIITNLVPNKVFFFNLIYETYKQTSGFWRNLKMTLKNFCLFANPGIFKIIFTVCFSSSVCITKTRLLCF